MYKKIEAAINWFVPAKFDTDLEAHRRARGIVIVSFLMAPWFPFFAFSYFDLHVSPMLPAFVLAQTGVVALAPILLRFTKSVVASANLLTASVFATITLVAYFDGGLHSQGVLALTYVILVAMVLGSVRSGFFWMAATLAFLFLLNEMHKRGHEFKRLVSEEGADQLWLLALVATVINSTLVAAYYEKIRNQLYAMAKKRGEALEATNKRMIEQQQLLVQASKVGALGEMAGGIAHEINTPLAIIQLRSDQMKELITEAQINTALVAELSENISTTVTRIAKIVQGLKSFSRDAGEDPFLPTSVADIVKDTLVFCREKFRQHQIDFRVGELTNERVLCRPVQISQVLLNLLSNAADAVNCPSCKNKWIELKVDTSRDNTIRIIISDNGGGIPQSVREKMFQPFFTTKEVGKGTGLGLSVSKGIIELHKGSLQLDLGTPTTFIVALPKLEAQKALKIG